MKSGLLIGDA